jgi:hypothetical protein
MTMRLKEEDIVRLILACELYKDTTGSEYIWDEYNELVGKLKTYLEQYSTDDE